MEPISSSARSILGRIVKIVMVVFLLPLTIGLVLGILQQLEQFSALGATLREWTTWGFLTYVGIHVLLYRPVTLFRISHRVFSTLAVWLFGGQVTAVENIEEDTARSQKERKKAKPDPEQVQGSTLVAFSPYVVPVYALLLCAAGLVLTRWWDRLYVEGPLTFLIGMAVAFHWLMTADDLQQQRSRWHLETYLLAIGLVFLLTLLLGAMCLPWAVPEFSATRALADGWTNTQAIYVNLSQRLLF